MLMLIFFDVHDFSAAWRLNQAFCEGNHD